MTYGVSNGHVTDDVIWPPKVLWGSTVGYPSDSLASCSQMATERKRWLFTFWGPPPRHCGLAVQDIWPRYLAWALLWTRLRVQYSSWPMCSEINPLVAVTTNKLFWHYSLFTLWGPSTRHCDSNQRPPVECRRPPGRPSDTWLTVVLPRPGGLTCLDSTTLNIWVCYVEGEAEDVIYYWILNRPTPRSTEVNYTPQFSGLISDPLASATTTYINLIVTCFNRAIKIVLKLSNS